MQKIPATVVTGFLGAGKTTLIRHLIQNAGGRRIALIVNEFGDVGVDGELLRGCGAESCSEDDIVELANGCICCTVADEFIPTMEKLLGRGAPPDHIVIETSGLALPKPLVKAFNWPEVKSRVTVDGVVTVVDAAALAEGRFATDETALAEQRAADPTLDHDNPVEEVFEDQLLCADMVLLNKSDLLDEASVDRLSGDLKARVRPGTRLVPTRHGRLEASALLGLGASAENDLATRPSHHELEGEDHEHDDFDTFVVALGSAVSKAELLDRIRNAVVQHDILRLKGFADIEGEGSRLLIQAVGPRVDSYFDRPWAAGEPRGTSLVVIGLKGLDRQAIEKTLAT